LRFLFLKLFLKKRCTQACGRSAAANATPTQHLKKKDSQGHVEESLLLLQHNLRRGSLVSEKNVDAQSVTKKNNSKTPYEMC